MRAARRGGRGPMTADPLSPQVGGGILFCACEANVSVANKAEALRRRYCCCKGQPKTAFIRRPRLRTPLSARAANLSS
jgi:hypothetical protein